MKKLLAGKDEIDALIEGIARSIANDIGLAELSETALIGIQAKGVVLASRLSVKLKEITGTDVLAGSLDISMYRDDIGMKKSIAAVRETCIPFDINDRLIILTDDVLHTGRTIRAALDALTDYGRPSYIKLAVLVDRSGREFPIQADFRGMIHKVSDGRRISLEWEETEGLDALYLIDG